MACPARVIVRMLTATYGESVISTPMYDSGEPSGPMLNGTTYIVRPAHASPEQPVERRPHLGGVLPVVRGPGVDLALGADERAVLDAGDVFGIGTRPVRAGAALRVERDEGAGLDELLAEHLELGVGTVAPVHRVGLAELHHLVDPANESLVLRGGLHERHGHVPPAETKSRRV